MAVTRERLYEFMNAHKLAVLATVAMDGSPQAAVMGIAVTPELEVIFDTLRSTRKYRNLRTNPRVAFVIGGEGEVTVQYEGIAEEPADAELHACKKAYFAKWPDGPQREHWPGMTYIRVRPAWIRYSDFNEASREIAEMTFDAAAGQGA